MRWLVLTLVACRAAEPHVATGDAAAGGGLDASIDASATLDASAVGPSVKTTPPVIHSQHGVAIRALAVTDDGQVAVTADVSGSVRLWPSLDGKRQPVIVTAGAPVALAIEHDGDDLAIAGVDAAGTLELIRLTVGGEAISRVTLELDRPVV